MKSWVLFRWSRHRPLNWNIVTHVAPSILSNKSNISKFYNFIMIEFCIPCKTSNRCIVFNYYPFPYLNYAWQAGIRKLQWALGKCGLVILSRQQILPNLTLLNKLASPAPTLMVVSLSSPCPGPNYHSPKILDWIYCETRL